MAWTKVTVLFQDKIHVTTCMRANDVECVHQAFTGTAEVDSTNGNLGGFVPGIHPRGEDGKFAGQTIGGKCIESRDSHGAAPASFAPQGIEEDRDSSAQWNQPN